jgi:hypothetical protein
MKIILSTLGLEQLGICHQQTSKLQTGILSYINAAKQNHTTAISNCTEPHMYASLLPIPRYKQINVSEGNLPRRLAISKKDVFFTELLKCI